MAATSVSAASLRLRSVLASTDFPTEAARKAALRRVLHESAAGMRKEEVTDFIEGLRGRFPDRVFETAGKAEALEKRAAQLQEELRLTRVAQRRLEEKVAGQDLLLTRLLSAAGKPGGGKAASGAPQAGSSGAGSSGAGSQGIGSSGIRSSGIGSSGIGPGGADDPAALVPFIEATVLLLRFAQDQEATAHTVDETLARARAASAEGDLAGLFARLSRGEPTASRDLAQVERTLRHLQLLPGALLAGAQQSWKAGTREVLENLDPKSAEATVPTKMPGLREAAVLKEVRRRFEEFWGQFDKNVAHFYRGKLERIYTEKMEDRP